MKRWLLTLLLVLYLTAALLPSVRAVRSGLLCPKDPMTRCELALVPARAAGLVQVS